MQCPECGATYDGPSCPFAVEPWHSELQDEPDVLATLDELAILEGLE
jgi:hypothetical protein